MMANQTQHFVLLIHGIRTTSRWVDTVRANLEKSDSITRVIPITYGYFDLFRFLIPGWWRSNPAKNVAKEISEIKAHHPDCNISILAHSFGTYTISKVLEKDSKIKLLRLALCGSIVSEEYDWRKHKGQIKETIINDCGTKDIWPVIASSITIGYGASGRFGFGKEAIDNRKHKLNHSGFLTKKFTNEYWLPFFQDGTVIRPPGEDEDQKPDPWLLSVITTIKLWWFILLLIGFGLFNLGLEIRKHIKYDYISGTLMPGEKKSYDLTIMSGNVVEITPIPRPWWSNNSLSFDLTLISPGSFSKPCIIPGWKGDSGKIGNSFIISANEAGEYKLEVSSHNHKAGSYKLSINRNSEQKFIREKTCRQKTNYVGSLHS